MDLWLKLQQARNNNKSKIAMLEKMIENNESCDELPKFLRPQAILEKLRYVELEKKMKFIKPSVFNRKTNLNSHLRYFKGFNNCYILL